MQAVVKEKKGQWIEEMRGMAFHSEAEVQEEMTRRIMEERKEEA